MQTISLAEASENLAELVETLGTEPIVVTKGEKQVAILTSPDAAERERRARWESFFATSKEAAAELKSNLNKEGLSVEEFLEDLLRDES